MNIYRMMTTERAILKTTELVERVGRIRPCFVFCASKSALTLERSIAFKIGGSFNVDVGSFNRYLSKRVAVDKYLTKSSCSLLIHRLMKENKDKLEYLKVNSFNVPKDVYQMIAQLKSAMVTPEKLQAVVDNEKGAFHSKLNDILIIFKAYEEYLKVNNLTDDGEFLSLMPNVVEKDEGLIGAKVIISCLPSYTTQTMNIIEALNKVCDVDVVLVGGDEPCYTNEGLNKLKNLDNVSIFDDDKVDMLEENKQIAKALYSPYKLDKIKSDKIVLSSKNDIYDECDSLAKRIRYEVVNNNLRYKDFVVACPVVEDYYQAIVKSFSLYDIPFYADIKKPLSNHPLIELIGALVDFRFNSSTKNIKKIIKSGLVCDSGDGDKFIKYLIENSISYKTLKSQFADEDVEVIRKNIFDCIDILANSKNNARDYAESIKCVFDRLGVKNRLDKLSAELEGYHFKNESEYNNQAYQKLYALFDECLIILKDTNLTLKEYKNLLIGSVNGTDVSPIPEYFDNVFVGDYESGSKRSGKILFCVGLNSNMPQVKSDVALLSDRDLTKIDGYKMLVEPKISFVNKRNQETLAITLMSFIDKLYISYPLLDIKGQATTKSSVVEDILGAFDGVISKNAEQKGEYSVYDYMSKKAGKISANINMQEFIDKDTNDLTYPAVYFNLTNEEITLNKPQQIVDSNLAYNGEFSPTMIEKHFDCPYKCFVSNILKLHDFCDEEIVANEFGNMLHNVLENFIKEFDKIKDESMAEKLALSLFEREQSDKKYSHYLNMPKYVSVFNEVKLECKKECKKIYNEFMNSDFKPYKVEYAFGVGNEPPIILSTTNGDKKLSGRIDRIDKWENYFRIVDYKTGSVDGDIESKLYYGQKIQLFLYMQVMLKDGKIPAGAYYYKMNDDYSQDGSDGGVFMGKTIKDVNVIYHSDTTIKDTNKSQFLGFTFAKNQEIKAGKGNVLSVDEFYKYTDYAKKIATSGADEMIKGVAIPSPIYTDDMHNSCSYCQYKGLCGYNITTGEYNRTIDIGKLEFKSVIGEKPTDEEQV